MLHETESLPELSELDIAVFDTLIRHVESHGIDDSSSILSYSDLTVLVNRPEVIPTNVGYYLGHIAEFCLALNIPVICSVAVNKDEKVPGRGYYTAIGLRCYSGKQNKEAYWSNNLTATYAFKDWEDVKKYY